MVESLEATDFSYNQGGYRKKSIILLFPVFISLVNAIPDDNIIFLF